MDPEDRMRFAARLRAAREHKGVTQIELAEALGLTQARVSDAERTGGALRKRHAELATILSVPAEWLGWGTGKPPAWENKKDHASSAPADTLIDVIAHLRGQVAQACAAGDLGPALAESLKQDIVRLESLVGRARR